MKQGIVTKNIGGICFIYSEYNRREIRAYMRKKLKQKVDRIIPGDRVLFEETGCDEGVIEDVLPRETELTRPRVANACQAIVVMSLKNPPFQKVLVDKIIVQVEASGLEPLVCINKVDLGSEKEIQELTAIYDNAGFKVLTTSTKTGDGIEEFRRVLINNISVLAGPSGAGKSSLLNSLNPDWNLKMGNISKKLKRGRHTTRHSELLVMSEGGLVADTPGYSVLDFSGIETQDLPLYFREFADFILECKFQDCLHDQEPECAVKKAVKEGKISASRYESYINFLHELKERRNNYG